MWRKKKALREYVFCLVIIVNLCDAHQFLTQSRASQFLSRQRRANSMLEKHKSEKLERECIEELCNKEEAREIFENYPETEYFYSKYVVCLGSHPVGINHRYSRDTNHPSDLRTCVKEISDQCLPFPCHKEGSQHCIDGRSSFTCQCKPGWKGVRCEEDLDECESRVCEGVCANTPGSYSCHCDGRQGLRLAGDQRSCVEVPVCLQLFDHKDPEMLYLGEQFTGRPVKNTRFAAKFDLRTFDPEGVVLYAKSFNGWSSATAWFMVGLRGGRLEVQFKNQHSLMVTSGGKAINDGQWHVISVDQLESSVSIKISKDAVMSINIPDSLFTYADRKKDIKVYIAGLPKRTDTLIKPINPRLDGCIRGWNLMNQAELGSWKVDLKMSIRPSSSTGVLFALVANNTVLLSVSVVTKGPDEADLQVFLDGVSVATLQSLLLCSLERLAVVLTITPTTLEITANLSSSTYSLPDNALVQLNNAMKHPVNTYIGGLPDEIPVSSSPVSAYYHGCMDININGQQVDFDEAVSKHNSIKSHSCPPVSPPDTHTIDPHLSPYRK
ncbi:hypothetical protein UPYG_G00157020 [Umbra pygmaea]|uniref:Vitamin K-dependent protein S n=1 Tax=Umbra pygmaea TaxID=75934 RepID=A0ABD0X2J8_UMBPY